MELEGVHWHPKMVPGDLFVHKKPQRAFCHGAGLRDKMPFWGPGHQNVPINGPLGTQNGVSSQKPTLGPEVGF